MKMVKDMTQGDPTKLLLQFSIPMLIGNIFQQFYNMVDSIVVGKFVGQDALAAVGVTGPINFFIFSLTLGLGAGLSIVISQFYGAKEYDNVKKAFATTIYTVIGAALLMGIIGFFSSRFLLELLNTPDSIIGQADMYLKISCAGILGVCGYNGIASVLRALGDSVTPLIFLGIASVLNIVLDLLFVVVFHMDVPGVAIATIISQLLSAIGCTIFAMKKMELLRLSRKEIKIDRVIFKKGIRLGIPIALQNSFISMSTMALQGVVNNYGKTTIAAASIAGRIEQLILQPGMSLGVAISSYTGQNIGANQVERVKKGFFAATRIIIIFSLVMLPIIYFGGGSIMQLFTKTEDYEVVRQGIDVLRIPSFFYCFLGMIFVSRNFLSGAGDVKIPMAMGFTEVVCRVLFANLLSYYMGSQGIWLATGLTWFFTSIVGVLRYRSGKWKYKSVLGK